MTDPVQISSDEIRQRLDEESLREWVQHQRWYASKSRAVAGIEIVESVTLREEPLLVLALVQTRFATGTHELYQLPLGLAPAGRVDTRHAIAQTDEWAVYDALSEPSEARELLRRVETTDEIETAEGRFTFARSDGMRTSAEDSNARLMGVEQSNSSIVFDDELVLKVFRKLEPGVNPELEVLRFLTVHGFPNIAPLRGWYEYDGSALATTLGVAQEFLPDARGGWELALDELGCRSRGLPGPAGQPRDGDRRDAQRARLGRRRSRVLSRGAQPGVTVAADRDRRRGHRADLRAPARRRAPGTDHRPRPGRPRAAGRPRPGRDHRPRDPDPRRLSPRPDAVHAARLGDHRLRGRAGTTAAGAPSEALATA